MRKSFVLAFLATGLLLPISLQAQDATPAAETAPVEAAPAEAPAAEAAPAEAPAAEAAPAEAPAAEVTAAEAPAAEVPVVAEPLAKAELFAELPPEICVTPDSFVIAPWGDMLLSCPNYADPEMPRVIMSISPENKIRLWSIFPNNPNYKISTEPGKLSSLCGPMGMEFGPDGNLYVVDNVGWYGDPLAGDPDFQSGRILRILVKNNRPVGAEVVAYNLSHPNDIKIKDGWIYVSHSMLAKEGEDGKTLVSAVYRFPLDAQNVRVSNTLDDPQTVVTTRTTKLWYGIDGICFGNQGELYIGNFGDGTIEKVTFDADGKASQPEIFAQGPEMLTNDGMFFDKENGHIYVCDFSQNAILDVDPDGKVRILAKNPDCDGRDGLDQPAGVILRGKQLIISNFDNVTGEPHTNSGHDEHCTLSVINLEGILK